MGEVTLSVEPSASLKPLRLDSFGKMTAVRGVSVCTFLEERKVAERQARAANEYLGERGYSADIDIVDDRSNPLQRGSSLVLWAETDANVILGADAIGELRKSSEAVGKEAAEKLHSEISVRPTVDVHLADLLIPYLALIQGASSFLVREISEHLETNIWLAEKMLEVKFKIEKTKGLHRVEKIPSVV
jgi:RNA 3'-terminal phosphate cyclase